MIYFYRWHVACVVWSHAVQLPGLELPGFANVAGAFADFALLRGCEVVAHYLVIALNVELSVRHASILALATSCKARSFSYSPAASASA